MLNYIVGDITKVAGVNQLLCHGCNCSGGFGSGVAGAIRKAYPIVYKKFKTIKPSPDLLGTAQIVPISLVDNFFVANCFTQINYGSDGKAYADYDAIYKALDYCYNFVAQIEDEDMEICAPKIGCGLGGLVWENSVENIFLELYNKYKIKTKIFTL
jgi:O-acetyl-ADP-ribose deacetylase (regulator of RNase III)